MSAPEEEQVWRLPNMAKGKDTKLLGGSGTYRSPSLSPAARERLGRIVARTPEVMVKVTGRTRGITHLKAHLDYLTRNGRIVAETQSGELIGDRAGLRELHDEWVLSNAAEPRGRNTPQGAQSVGIILSMPPGAPRDRVQDAARTWARETFADRTTGSWFDMTTGTTPTSMSPFAPSASTGSASRRILLICKPGENASPVNCNVSA
jgi:hypothetical protein